MRKFAPLIAGSIALALAACGDTDDTTVVQTETTEPAPVVTATETTVIDRDANRDGVTVNRNGLQVDVDSGGTSIRADIGDDPSVTVRD